MIYLINIYNICNWKEKTQYTLFNRFEFFCFVELIVYLKIIINKSNKYNN